MPEQDIFEQDSDIEIQADIPQSVTIAEYAGEVEVGEVTTLPAGSDATVTNRGTATKAILDFGLPKGDSGADWGEIGGDLSDQPDLANALNGLQSGIDSKAAKNNAILTGTPVAPTATDNTNTTQIATTEFVQNAIALLRQEIVTKVNKMLGRMNFGNLTEFTISWARAKGQSGAITQTNYTVPEDGYIKFLYRSSGSGSSTFSGTKEGIAINSKILIDFLNCNTSGMPTALSAVTAFDNLLFGDYLPVSKDDVISYDCDIYSTQTSINRSYKFLFIPQKTV